MAKFDLYPFNGGLVVDLQADIIDIPGSRVVAPVFPEDEMPPVTPWLHPQVTIDGERFVVATHLLAATPEAALRAPIGSLRDFQDELTRSIDTLFFGF